MRHIAAASLTLVLTAAAPAQAEVLHFHVALAGKGAPADTGSDATGTASVAVDTDRHLVSVDLAVHGITIDNLWDKLVAAPIGPVHFHEYKPEGNSALALPLPFGANYAATADGFRVTMRDYDYAAGAKLLNSTLSFDDFVAAMRAGKVALNVHTDAFNPGEIGGTVVAD